MASFNHKDLSDHDFLDANAADSFGVERGPLSNDIARGTTADPNPETPVTGALTIDGTDGDDDLVVNATSADSGTYSLNGGPAIRAPSAATLDDPIVSPEPTAEVSLR